MHSQIVRRLFAQHFERRRGQFDLFQRIQPRFGEIPAIHRHVRPRKRDTAEPGPIRWRRLLDPFAPAIAGVVVDMKPRIRLPFGIQARTGAAVDQLPGLAKALIREPAIIGIRFRRLGPRAMSVDDVLIIQSAIDGRRSEMQFADIRRAIARIPEQFRKNGFMRWQMRDVCRRSALMRKLAGEQRRSRGNARRIRSIGARKNHSVAGKRIELRRANSRIGPVPGIEALFIGQQEKNVRRGWHRRQLLWPFAAKRIPNRRLGFALRKRNGSRRMASGYDPAPARKVQHFFASAKREFSRPSRSPDRAQC
ncbi:MAG: hypothetical protein BWZ10_01353 [candidate division BRC1 bacterium ADurb.BinA364]|nr:MAG: hypothetical protein BWZ10_01353 [candidate division BRC1 bacterium ADurb.BinA364]